MDTTEGMKFGMICFLDFKVLELTFLKVYKKKKSILR